ncbi:MAG TPA: SDR family oxidoreductase, partial [Ilumatobacteraceae bacterium]|nr:SDR family oxidoreductase [Ilumatobacteraceae bacterium]
AVAAATAGLGLSSAMALAAEGVEVVICGRDQERLDAAVATIGHGARSVLADVGTAAGAERFVVAASELLGGLDILVTNAGGPPAGNFASTSVDAYLPAVELNLLSVVAMCKAAVPGMQASGWGRVVAITSVSVRQPMANLILSNTARAGTTAFIKTLAREVAADGVTANTIQPGLHATDRLTNLYGEGIDQAVAEIPARLLGRPADFGATVAFLCSDMARFITGTNLHLDGGSYAGLL